MPSCWVTPWARGQVEKSEPSEITAPDYSFGGLLAGSTAPTPSETSSSQNVSPHAVRFSIMTPSTDTSSPIPEAHSEDWFSKSESDRAMGMVTVDSDKVIDCEIDIYDCRKEAEGFANRRVCEVWPRYEATNRGAKVVGVRWVDTMKGEKVRLRLVCQDLNTDRGRNDEMFAATPPLLASRYLVSRMASQGQYQPGPQR